MVYGGPEPVQSPAWLLMDVAFLAFGLALAVGAMLIRPLLPARPLATVVATLWMVVGVSSAAAGVVPLDVDEAAHVALSAPALLLQPVALVLLGLVLRGRWHRPTLGVGLLSVVGAVGYLSRPGTAAGAGVFERLALWPAYLWLPVVALALAARTRPPGPSVPDRAAR